MSRRLRPGADTRNDYRHCPTPGLLPCASRGRANRFGITPGDLIAARWHRDDGEAHRLTGYPRTLQAR